MTTEYLATPPETAAVAEYRDSGYEPEVKRTLGGFQVFANSFARTSRLANPQVGRLLAVSRTRPSWRECVGLGAQEILLVLTRSDWSPTCRLF
jgi:hypothetical protein